MDAEKQMGARLTPSHIHRRWTKMLKKLHASRHVHIIQNR